MVVGEEVPAEQLFLHSFIHALTVRSLPGEHPIISVLFKLSCLFVPYAGVTRGLCLILRASKLTPNDLRAAVQSGAMCMVVRTKEWKPMDGDVVEGCKIAMTEGSESKGVQGHDERVLGSAEELRTFGGDHGDRGEGVGLCVEAPYKPRRQPTFAGTITQYLILSYRFRERRIEESYIDQSITKIQGVCSLPPGYALCYVPHDMEVRPRWAAPGLPTPKLTISSSTNFARVIFSLFQTISGVYSLYHTKGRQVEKWGVAAYGLTVIPYVLVSVVNLLGSLASSEYEAVVLCHSGVLEEMVRRGGVVEGVVGSVERDRGEEAVGSVTVGFTVGEEVTGRRLGSLGLGDEPFVVLPPEPTEKTSPCCSKRKRQFPRQRCPGLLGIPWIRSRLGLRDDASSQPLSPTPRLTLTIPSHSPFHRLRPPRHQALLNVASILLWLSAYIGPYLIIWRLTHFRHNESTSDKYSATIQWLVYGQVSTLAASIIEKANGKKDIALAMVHAFVIYGPPGLIGYTRVVEMMVEGTCL